jgi:hypothetical protein
MIPGRAVEWKAEKPMDKANGRETIAPSCHCGSAFLLKLRRRIRHEGMSPVERGEATY